GGGAPLPIGGGGGPPRPGGYCVGAPAMLAPTATAATAPPSPAGACAIGAPAGTPRPAALPTPGPPATPASGTRAIPTPSTLTSLGGGPSTVIETRFSPRSRTRPRTRFSSRSADHGPLKLPSRTHLIFLNSSQSHRIRFMCLSNALNVPMKIRPSWRIQRIRKSMCCNILLLLPTVWKTGKG
uniref:Uncharacterized protein n=1 Tax=Cyprinus carpio TaxID=7962 RepID=A0A8C2BKJ0_CYPCA